MNLNATLFGQMITFAIFVWFTMRVIWPILLAKLNEREKIIADGMAAAEKGHKILADAEESAKQKIHETKQHCYKMLEDADREANKIIAAAKETAQREHDQLIAAGNAQVARAIKQAKTELQAQLSGLVVLGAERILERSINPADHRDILESLTKKLA
jgi:F-type H+-transporting ATPase subunit b